jgi:hypothetical protein
MGRDASFKGLGEQLAPASPVRASIPPTEGEAKWPSYSTVTQRYKSGACRTVIAFRPRARLFDQDQTGRERLVVQAGPV